MFSFFNLSLLHSLSASLSSSLSFLDSCCWWFAWQDRERDILFPAWHWSLSCQQKNDRKEVDTVLFLVCCFTPSLFSHPFLACHMYIHFFLPEENEKKSAKTVMSKTLAWSSLPTHELHQTSQQNTLEYYKVRERKKNLLHPAFL